MAVAHSDEHLELKICSPDQDFEMNQELKLSVIGLLEEVLRDPDLLPQERKATANILRYTTTTLIQALFSLLSIAFHF